ncbi:FHA domain protein [Actinomyces sp. oral taxon 448 str. F0400]|nr:FHA domain protein [Actinomyces sp. oral taxon 448 str. F0400]
MQDDSPSATVAALGDFNRGGLRRISDDTPPSPSSSPLSGPTGLDTDVCGLSEVLPTPGPASREPGDRFLTRPPGPAQPHS